jgi:hypothetical protein
MKRSSDTVNLPFGERILSPERIYNETFNSNNYPALSSSFSFSFSVISNMILKKCIVNLFII